MKQSGVKPDAIILNILVDVCCEAGDMGQADYVFHHLYSEYGIKRTTGVFSSIIKG